MALGSPCRRLQGVFHVRLALRESRGESVPCVRRPPLRSSAALTCEKPVPVALTRDPLGALRANLCGAGSRSPGRPNSRRRGMDTLLALPTAPQVLTAVGRAREALRGGLGQHWGSGHPAMQPLRLETRILPRRTQRSSGGRLQFPPSEASGKSTREGIWLRCPRRLPRRPATLANLSGSCPDIGNSSIRRRLNLQASSGVTLASIPWLMGSRDRSNCTPR